MDIYKDESGKAKDAILAQTKQDLGEKADKIDELKMDLRRAEAKRQEAEAKRQEAAAKASAEREELIKMNKALMARTNDIHVELKETRVELKDMARVLSQVYTLSLEIARFALPRWTGATVFKGCRDDLMETYTLMEALKHMKLMFVTAFYSTDADGGLTNMVVYISNTNFADVSKRIKTLCDRHTGYPDNMTMLKPEAIGLGTDEINHEIACLEQLLPSERTASRIDRRTKAFLFQVNVTDVNDVQNVYDEIVTNTREMNFQGYQIRRDAAINEESFGMSDEFSRRLVSSDTIFFDDSRPLCQEYLDLCSARSTEGYRWCSLSTSRTSRSEFDNIRTTAAGYVLLRLNRLFENEAYARKIEEMFNAGTIPKSDAKAFARFMRRVVEAENIPVSEEALAEIEEAENIPSDGSDLTDDEDSDEEY